MRLGQELKFKNKLCNLKLGTFFSALPGLGASAPSGHEGNCRDAWRELQGCVRGMALPFKKAFFAYIFQL